MTRLRTGFVLLAVLALAALTSTALGFWTGSSSNGGGSGSAGAATVAQGAAPIVTENGSANVVVSWGSTSLSNGVAVSGYVVKRYAETDGALATIGAGCAGTIAATTCTETATPVGDWEYTVTPVLATNWRGAESLRSGGVNTGPGGIVLDRTLFGGTVAPLPAPVGGTISGFTANEAITYTLDDSVTLTGATPTHAGPAGTATISLTIPAGTSDGPHSITVLGAGADASVGIVVDTTAPTISTFLTPAPNAAGWNNTAPVEVGGTASDGNGSGVAFAKYTDDGSNPKTVGNPNATLATGPLSVSVTTTLKYYLADLAGNESAVLTQPVRIDTMPPYFSVALTDVVGGVFQGPTVAGVPATAYYRGATAGSMRFTMTPVPTSGSPAISAGFSALPPEGVGFSFDSSAVTTPLGGPFVSNAMSWAAGTTSTPTGTISLTNAAGNTFGAPGALVNDSAAPVGGSVAASGLVGTGGRYSTSLTLSLLLAKGADAESGLADATGGSDVTAKLQRASATLSSSDGVADGTCGTYSAYVQLGSADPASTVSDTVPTDRLCYRYRYLVSDHVGNIATYSSADIKVIAVPAGSLTPTGATLSAASGVSAQSISGSTVYYNPAQLGSFNVDSSASSPYAGIAQFGFPAITGFSGGGVVTAPLTGSTFRSTYAWSANGASPSPGAQAITATNNAGGTATNSSAFTVVKDDVAPSGGAVDATGLGGTGGRYSTSMTLSVGFTRGSDGGSGLASSGAQLRRASATLISGGVNNGTCDTFGAYSQIGADDPASPKSDTVPVDRLCYRYAYVVPDKVGNVATYTSPVIKVYAAAPPAPALAFSALTNAYATGTGTQVFYRPGASSGGFTLTATSVDATGYTFPTLPAGWSSSSGGAGIQGYSWAPANPTAPSGNQTVTMTSNAGSTATATFTATPDSTGPSGGNVTYTNGYSNGSTVGISFSKGTDPGGSGVDAASGIVEVSSATLSGGACGTFGGWTTGATNPTSGVLLSVVTDTCYRYRYSISDNVGNQTTYTNANVAMVDSVGPNNAFTMVSPVNAYLKSPNTVYYKGNAVGSFKLVDAVTDSGSGPASATFLAIATTGWTHGLETVGTPTGGPYTSTTFSWTPGAANPANQALNSTDVAGNTSPNGSITFTSDVTAPAGGTISYPDGVVNVASVAITTTAAGDSGSQVNPAATVVQRSSAPLTTLTESCGTFSGFATVSLVGGADTSVTSGNCYQYRYFVPDNVGNQGIFTSANVAKVDTSGPQVTSITSLNVSGGTSGKLETGDKLVLTFNQSLLGVPLTFGGATETEPLLPLLGNVLLTIPGITQGALDTGSPSYLFLTAGTATFGGTLALANNGAATTVTITVTSVSGTLTTAGNGVMAFKAAATITDSAGHAATGTFTTPNAFMLF
jgi:hypothetical protein